MPKMMMATITNNPPKMTNLEVPSPLSSSLRLGRAGLGGEAGVDFGVGAPQPSLDSALLDFEGVGFAGVGFALTAPEADAWAGLGEAALFLGSGFFGVSMSRCRAGAQWATLGSRDADDLVARTRGECLKYRLPGNRAAQRIAGVVGD